MRYKKLILSTKCTQPKFTKSCFHFISVVLASAINWTLHYAYIYKSAYTLQKGSCNMVHYLCNIQGILRIEHAFYGTDKSTNA